jgi:hypothetical protein
MLVLLLLEVLQLLLVLPCSVLLAAEPLQVTAQVQQQQQLALGCPSHSQLQALLGTQPPSPLLQPLVLLLLLLVATNLPEVQQQQQELVLLLTCLSLQLPSPLQPH